MRIIEILMISETQITFLEIKKKNNGMPDKTSLGRINKFQGRKTMEGGIHKFQNIEDS